MQKHLIFLFCLLFSITALGQGQRKVEITLENPNNSMYVHLYYLQNDSYQPDLAAQALFEEGDSLGRIKKAIQLKQILDSGGFFVYFNQIPTEANYIDSLVNRAVYTPFPKKMPEIYLEKTNGKWYYSQETVANIPNLHKKVYPFGADLLLNNMPRMGQSKILGLAVWQYFGLLIMLVLALLIHLVLSRTLNPLVRKLSQSRLYPSLIQKETISKIARLLSILLVIWLIKIFLPVLLLPVKTSIFAQNTIKVVSTILIILIALQIVNIFIKYTLKFTRTTESKMDEQLVPIIKRSIQAVIIIGGIIHLLQILDVNITALIAGLSIGGLALALAAQDTVKNLIGSAMIFADRPFQIGDYIESSGHAGTVIEVGFRSTRVQQSDSSIITIPNGSMASTSVTNKGVRVYRLFQMNLGVTYDTPLSLLKLYIEGLKKIVHAHPNTKKDGYYIHLNNLADSSINILFRVPLEVPDYGGELKVKEELLFSILALAEKIGVRFAFPSTTLYMEEFPGKGTTAPPYETDEGELKKRFDAFVEDEKNRI